MMNFNYDKTRPLALNPILISRADNSSNNDERPRGKENIVDCNGEPVLDPDKTPDKIALEKNPNLMFEHWDEFWRKVHGPRVVYQDGEDDNMCKNVCTYYQIHRLPAAPSSTFPPPYNAIVNEYGMLYPAKEIHVPPYKRPLYDGLVYWGAPTISELIPVGYSKKAKEKVNFEGNVFTRNAITGLSSEYIIIPLQETYLPPFCTVKIHYRKNGGKETFRKYLLNEHSRLIREKKATKRFVKRFAYILCENKDIDEPFANLESINIDALSVTYFNTMNDCEEYFSSADYGDISKAESGFIDQARSEWWTGVIYPFFYPTDEQITDINKKIK